jgi:hypothetical protein
MDPVQRIAWVAYAKGLMTRVLTHPSQLTVEGRLGVQETIGYLSQWISHITEETRQGDFEKLQKGRLLEHTFVARQHLMANLNRCALDLDARDAAAVPYVTESELPADQMTDGDCIP